MTSRLEKGGGSFEGIKLLLCENPLPPLEEAIEAARAELGRSNYYTEPHSEPLRRQIARMEEVPERLIHINAGSELILRQIYDRLGDQVPLLSPTYALFPEIARRYTETRLSPERGFDLDLAGRQRALRWGFERIALNMAWSTPFEDLSPGPCNRVFVVVRTAMGGGAD